ncbi:T9SS type A sorting domain-containing protein [Winogradskyella sp.]|uniref:T9SS type A sorting domain-containing protein n=1 Tax=Winogradskyella sp. TaxID=1883156 RepID=UPI0025CEECEE|nr:T9SS type A sorting domain-containing protein [Winogradskyella sp.]
MANKIYIIILLISSLANAQYFGGSEDGSDQSTLTGSRLNGNIASFSVLYQGSSGDGFDMQNNQLILSNTIFDIYNGQSSDGFTQKTTALTLSGSKINSLYYGNSGDGFSQSDYQTVLNGQDLTILFSGNNGDGSDNEQTFGLLLGGFMSDLFKGGIGDGFTSAFKPNNYLSGLMLVLFNGGNGDGFAVNNYTTALTLDIVEQLIRMEVLLYPNPASQIVNIKSNDGLTITSVEVYDISGKKINIKLSRNNSLNISNLANGVYLLNIISDDRSVTKKLIIKK